MSSTTRSSAVNGGAYLAPSTELGYSNASATSSALKSRFRLKNTAQRSEPPSEHIPSVVVVNGGSLGAANGLRRNAKVLVDGHGEVPLSTRFDLLDVAQRVAMDDLRWGTFRNTRVQRKKRVPSASTRRPTRGATTSDDVVEQARTLRSENEKLRQKVESQRQRRKERESNENVVPDLTSSSVGVVFESDYKKLQELHRKQASQLDALKIMLEQQLDENEKQADLILRLDRDSDHSNQNASLHVMHSPASIVIHDKREERIEAESVAVDTTKAAKKSVRTTPTASRPHIPASERLKVQAASADVSPFTNLLRRKSPRPAETPQSPSRGTRDGQAVITPRINGASTSSKSSNRNDELQEAVGDAADTCTRSVADATTPGSATLNAMPQAFTVEDLHKRNDDHDASLQSFALTTDDVHISSARSARTDPGTLLDAERNSTAVQSPFAIVCDGRKPVAEDVIEQNMVVASRDDIRESEGTGDVLRASSAASIPGASSGTLAVSSPSAGTTNVPVAKSPTVDALPPRERPSNAVVEKAASLYEKWRHLLSSEGESQPEKEKRPAVEMPRHPAVEMRSSDLSFGPEHTISFSATETGSRVKRQEDSHRPVASASTRRGGRIDELLSRADREHLRFRRPRAGRQNAGADAADVRSEAVLYQVLADDLLEEVLAENAGEFLSICDSFAHHVFQGEFL